MPKSEVLIAAMGDGPPDEPSFLQDHVDRYYYGRKQAWGGAQHIMQGQKPRNDSILLTSNDYLSIAGHEDIASAQIECLQQQGSAAIMSAVFLHEDSPQAQLERRLAAHLHMEDAVLSQSGYAANVGLLQAITAPDVPVYVDMFAHASLWEGAHSAAAPTFPFRHNDANHLAHQIRQNGPGIVVVDSVYSTSGSVAPLADLVDVVERYGCVSVIDESHSLGTHGTHGEGLVADLGLTDRVHFVTASLAKSFAGRAGLITCSRRLTEYISYHSFPAVFSSALLPQDIAGLDATLTIIRGAGERRRRLRWNADILRDQLDQLGYNVNASQSHIVGLEAGPELQTIVLRDALESRGIFGSVFCAPATAKNRSLIRFSINSGLTSSDIDRVVTVCRDIRDEVDLANWPSTRRKHRDKSSALSHAA